MIENQKAVLARYGLALAAIVIADILAALLISRVTGSTDDRSRIAAQWGTYGDWAGAIVPSFAILLTVHMWLRDARNRLIAGVYRESRPLGDWLVNDSDAPVWLQTDNGGYQKVPPNGENPVGHRNAIKFRDQSNNSWTIKRDHAIPGGK